MTAFLERKKSCHRHNSLGAYLTIHAAKVIVATPSQKWTKIKGWLNHPGRFLGKTQVRDNVATKLVLDHELPTLLLTFKLCPSFLKRFWCGGTIAVLWRHMPSIQ